MSHAQYKHPMPLRVVAAAPQCQDESANAALSAADSESMPRAADVDWTILMARAQHGDATAYLRLLQQISPYVRALAARQHRDADDIEDALQDVLLTVHSIRHTYDPGRPFGPWLVAIVKRRLIDRLRRHGRTSAHETPLTDEHEGVAQAEAAGVQDAADCQALRSAITHLTPTQKQAIELLKLNEMSLKEASAASGMTVGALKLATHRALLSLRKMLVRQSGGS